MFYSVITSEKNFIFRVCALLCKFRDLDYVTKITGHEYLKSRAILVYYLVHQAKTQKLRTPK